MLIVIGIKYTADPANWQWFFNLDKQPAQTEMELKELKLDDIDFQIKPERNGSLPAETFIALESETTPQVVFGSKNEIGQFPKELLSDIKDQQLKLLRREQPALEAIVQHLKSTSQQELEDAANRSVGFRVINVEPDAYRGMLIRIEGTLRNFTSFPFGDSQTTADDLYQGWVFTDDSGSKPWMILCTEKPTGLELQERMEVPMTVSGYFFKRYGYQSEGGMNVAPLLIAKSISLQPIRQARHVRNENISLYVIWVLGIISLLFALMIWRFYASDKKYENSHLAQIAESRRDADPEAIKQLNLLPTIDQQGLFKHIRESDNSEEKLNP